MARLAVRAAIATVAVSAVMASIGADGAAAWRQATQEEVASMAASIASGGGGILTQPECWEMRISDRDPSWGFALLATPPSPACNHFIHEPGVIKEEAGAWREVEEVGTPVIPCSVAMRVPQSIAEELGTCVPPPRRFQHRPSHRAICPHVRFGGPPEPDVYVSGISCIEAGVGVAPRQFYYGGLIEQLIGHDAEEFPTYYNRLPRRFPVPAHWEGAEVVWRCRATGHRLIERRFADFQIWIACGRGKQRVEVRMIFRPTIA